MSKTIQFVNVGAFVSGTAAVTVVMPAGLQVNDLLMILVHSENQAITAPTGWTEVGSQATQSVGAAGVAGGTRLGVFWKWAAATNPNVTVADTGVLTCAQAIAFRYVSTINPFIATSGGAQASSTANPTLPAVTTTVPNSLIFFAVAMGNDLSAGTNNFTSLTNANLTSITERMDTNVITQQGGGVAAWTAYYLPTGNTGTSTAVKNTATTGGGWGTTADTTAYLTIALRPKARRFSAS
jgi:hypothetical protein